MTFWDWSGREYTYGCPVSRFLLWHSRFLFFKSNYSFLVKKNKNILAANTFQVRPIRTCMQIMLIFCTRYFSKISSKKILWVLLHNDIECLACKFTAHWLISVKLFCFSNTAVLSHSFHVPISIYSEMVYVLILILLLYFHFKILFSAQETSSFFTNGILSTDITLLITDNQHWGRKLWAILKTLSDMNYMYYKNNPMYQLIQW